MSAMRFMVMAAERAATIATTIHKIWLSEGHPCLVARAASNAPVSANGSANTECSNLIISSTILMRLAISELCAKSRLRFFRGGRARSAVHLFLREANLRQDAANELRNKIVDRFRLVIESRYRGHNHRTGLLRPQHVFQMNAVDRRVANTQNEFPAFLEHHVRRSRDQIVADAVGDCAQRPHRAGNDHHGIHRVAARSDRSAHVFVGQNVDFADRMAENAARQLFQIAGSNAKLFRKEPLARLRDHKMYACHARVFLQQCERLLSEDRSAGAGHTYGDNLFLCVSHVFCADTMSLAAAEWQVKQRQSCSAMIEFATAGEYE